MALGQRDSATLRVRLELAHHLALQRAKMMAESGNGGWLRNSRSCAHTMIV